MHAWLNQPDPLIPELATQADTDSDDAWFRAEVQEALDSKKPRIPYHEVMAEMYAVIANAEARLLNQGHLGQPT